MVQLVIHAVQWCAAHGHPVLALRIAGGDRFFVVAIGAEDAAGLAPGGPAAAGKAGLLRLVEDAVAGLGGRPVAVWLRVGDDGVLRATLRVAGPRGEVSLPAAFADGIALANRARLPLLMEDADLARVPLGPGGTPPPARPPAPFRDLIDALDLDGLGGPTADSGTPPP
jgi:bifunctional DNase/RNase